MPPGTAAEQALAGTSAKWAPLDSSVAQALPGRSVARALPGTPAVRALAALRTTPKFVYSPFGARCDTAGQSMACASTHLAARRQAPAAQGHSTAAAAALQANAP